MKAVYIARPEPARTRAEQFAGRPVTDVMSRPVASVPEDTLLGDALRLMVQSRHRHLVIVDSAGRCVGVLVDRAVAAAWAHDPMSLDRLRVGAIMRPTAEPVRSRAKARDAARAMRDSGTDAVVVVDEEGAPVGIVTGTDLIALLAR
ncbi:CBS domain-containing protein [Actinomycetes bacterium KLBMP 9797]